MAQIFIVLPVLVGLDPDESVATEVLEQDLCPPTMAVVLEPRAMADDLVLAPDDSHMRIIDLLHAAQKRPGGLPAVLETDCFEHVSLFCFECA